MLLSAALHRLLDASFECRVVGIYRFLSGCKGHYHSVLIMDIQKVCWFIGVLFAQVFSLFLSHLWPLFCVMHWLSSVLYFETEPSLLFKATSLRAMESMADSCWYFSLSILLFHSCNEPKLCAFPYLVFMLLWFFFFFVSPV